MGKWVNSLFGGATCRLASGKWRSNEEAGEGEVQVQSDRNARWWMGVRLPPCLGSICHLMAAPVLIPFFTGPFTRFGVWLCDLWSRITSVLFYAKPFTHHVGQISHEYVLCHVSDDGCHENALRVVASPQQWGGLSHRWAHNRSKK